MITIEDMAGTGRRVQCRKVVIKLGSAVVMDRDRQVDVAAIESIADAVADLRRSKAEVIIVTSGSINIGRNRLKRPKPKTLPEKQGLAAIGQISLMHTYQTVLAERGLHAAQLLLTRGDMEDRRGYLNARYTLEYLLRIGAVPIINENDTTSTEEISFGDNDVLSAFVAAKMKADLLLLLSSVDGVYEKMPRGRGRGKLFDVIDQFDETVYGAVSERTDGVGFGGMRSKLDAARTARAAGVHTVVANGKHPGIVGEIFSGKFRGTYFPPDSNNRRISARARWIGFGKTSRGKLTLDSGAIDALIKKNTSLLAVGIVAVEGRFERGDIVEICDPSGNSVCRGQVNYSSEKIEKVKGRRSTEMVAILGERPYDEVVHRDNMVVLRHK